MYGSPRMHAVLHQRKRPPSIAQDHGALTIPSVDQRARRQTHHQIGQRPQCAGDASLDGRMRQAQDQQGKGCL